MTPNPAQAGTLLDLADEAQDQDGRQLARFRKFQKNARLLREARNNPDAVLTLANDIEATAEDGERDEQQDVETHAKWREAAKSLARREEKKRA